MSNSTYKRLQQSARDSHTSTVTVSSTMKHPLCPNNENKLNWGQVVQLLKDFQVVYPNMTSAHLQNNLFIKREAVVKDPGGQVVITLTLDKD